MFIGLATKLLNVFVLESTFYLFIFFSISAEYHYHTSFWCWCVNWLIIPCILNYSCFLEIIAPVLLSSWLTCIASEVLWCSSVRSCCNFAPSSWGSFNFDINTVRRPVSENVSVQTSKSQVMSETACCVNACATESFSSLIESLSAFSEQIRSM